MNYFGLIRCTKAALPIFKEQYPKRGRIVNITSMAGLVDSPLMSAYASSKHAANVVSHSLRAECQNFVDVVTVNPSFHETPLVDQLKEMYNQQHFDKLSPKLQSQYGLGEWYPVQWM